ncbi:EamA family transporter [uncultured Jatrophihabitans sp.]|uniref:EamA family transporter n=1 Tax=uncultured Jatrophihabitans sp. TaxID=1610747 RepID=UPI0035C9FF49
MPAQLTELTTAVILVAAVAHATWNALGKLIPDRLVSASWIGLVYLTAGAAVVPFLPLPHAAAWPYLAVSSIAQATYLLMLMAAYRKGEFGQIYPVTRGMAPLLVSVVSFCFLDERVSLQQLGGIAAVCAGLTGLVFVRGTPRRGSGYGMAALTGTMIAVYTLVDGVGVRHSGHPISYAAWLFALQGPLVPLGVFVVRGRGFVKDLAPQWRLGVVGGLLSLLSYGMIVWAQSRAPIAAVATLREVSVVLAAFLGRLMFREKLGPITVGAAVLVAGGVIAVAV